MCQNRWILKISATSFAVFLPQLPLPTWFFTYLGTICSLSKRNRICDLVFCLKTFKIVHRPIKQVGRFISGAEGMEWHQHHMDCIINEFWTHSFSINTELPPILLLWMLSIQGRTTCYAQFSSRVRCTPLTTPASLGISSHFCKFPAICKRQWTKEPGNISLSSCTHVYACMCIHTHAYIYKCILYIYIHMQAH